jgi:hypothetical protein
MGLDACVYCDCLEKGRLERPLPSDLTLKVDPNGYPHVMKNGESVWENDAIWNEIECNHPGRFFLRHRIGNISSVTNLRVELSRESSRFSILVQKVVYNGIHAGDYLALNIIPDLQKELERLASFKCVGNVPSKLHLLASKLFFFTRYYYTSPSEADEAMKYFRAQMLELCDAALKLGKPISF